MSALRTIFLFEGLTALCNQGQRHFNLTFTFTLSVHFMMPTLPFVMCDRTRENIQPTRVAYMMHRAVRPAHCFAGWRADRLV